MRYVYPGCSVSTYSNMVHSAPSHHLLSFRLFSHTIHHTPNPVTKALAPDLRRKVDANRAARLAREEETRRQMEAQVSKRLLFNPLGDLAVL